MAPLPPAQPQLVPPVEAFPVRALRLAKGDLARHVADLRIGQAPDEHPQRVGLPDGACVGEGDDVGLDGPDRCVLRSHLAAARAAEEPDAPVPPGELLDQGVHPVRGAVRGDDDLDPARVVLGEQALDEAGDHALLVVRGGDDGDARRLVALRHAVPEHG